MARTCISSRLFLLQASLSNSRCPEVLSACGSFALATAGGLTENLSLGCELQSDCGRSG